MFVIVKIDTLNRKILIWMVFCLVCLIAYFNFVLLFLVPCVRAVQFEYGQFSLCAGSFLCVQAVLSVCKRIYLFADTSLCVWVVPFVCGRFSLFAFSSLCVPAVSFVCCRFDLCAVGSLCVLDVPSVCDIPCMCKPIRQQNAEKFWWTAWKSKRTVKMFKKWLYKMYVVFCCMLDTMSEHKFKSILNSVKTAVVYCSNAKKE